MTRPAGVLALLLALAVAHGSQDVEAEIQALRSKLHEQRDLIKEQTRRLTELGEVAQDEGRRLQTNALMTTTYEMAGAMDSLWLCLCGALVMFMHAGFAMLETGSCRAKNASNVLMKNLVNVCMGTLGWWVVGWGIAYGEKIGTRLFGTTMFAGQGFYTRADVTGNITPVATCDASGCQSYMLSWFFQWAFCTAAATIVSGSVAERVKAPAFGFFALVMTSVIYPLIVAPTWGGGWGSVLFDVGVMDFAGSGIVHLTGGVAGLAGTCVLGARKGRFENPEAFEVHNLPLVVLGTFSLWFGWYGFNPGSTLSMNTALTGALAAQVAMNTTLSAATGGISVFLLRYIFTKKYDVPGMCNGILAGLVSITAGCGNVECGTAVLIGFIGAIFYVIASKLLTKLKIDDPVDAFPVHGACGIWGVIAAATFDWGKDLDHWNGASWTCKPALSGSGCYVGHISGSALAANLMMILCIIAWVGISSTVTFVVLKCFKWLRIDEETEEMGMDAASHSPPKAYALP